MLTDDHINMHTNRTRLNWNISHQHLMQTSGFQAMARTSLFEVDYVWYYFVDISVINNIITELQPAT